MLLGSRWSAVAIESGRRRVSLHNEWQGKWATLRRAWSMYCPSPVSSRARRRAASPTREGHERNFGVGGEGPSCSPSFAVSVPAGHPLAIWPYRVGEIAGVRPGGVARDDERGCHSLSCPESYRAVMTGCEVLDRCRHVQPGSDHVLAPGDWRFSELLFPALTPRSSPTIDAGPPPDVGFHLGA